MISIASHHPILQDCLLARRTGILAGPCRQPRTVTRRPAIGPRWIIGSRVSWTRHSSRGSSRTSHRRRCISSFSTADSRRAASWSRRPRPRSSPPCSTSICGATRSRDATTSSMSIASATGSKCWWTPGDSVAARTVAALDKHLVIVGLSRYLRVFDPGTFEPTESSDDEPIDRHDKMNSETSGDVLECEVGGYLLRARRTDAWDAIVTLLVTLEIEHNRLLSRGDAGVPPPVSLQAGDRRPRRSADCRRSSTSRTSRSNGSDGDRSTATRRRPTRVPSFRWRGSRSRQPDRRGLFRPPIEESTPSPEGTTFGRARRGGTRRRRQTSPRAATSRHPTIDRRGHRTAGRGWRDAGPAAGAARSRRRGPSSRENSRS